MKNTKHISSAYEQYAEVFNIIDVITDNGFISVTNFSKLLHIIFATNNIKPHIINKFLIEHGFLTKTTKPTFKCNTSCKYITNFSSLAHCKKITDHNIIFYIWDFNFLFGILGIDFKTDISQDNVQTLCSNIKQYAHIKVNMQQVYFNLLKLQTVLRNECIYFNPKKIKECIY